MRAGLRQEQDSKRRKGRMFVDLVMGHEIVMVRLLVSSRRVYGISAE